MSTYGAVGVTYGSVGGTYGSWGAAPVTDRLLYRVRIGWGGGYDSAFRIGISSIGGTDGLISDNLNPTFSGPYDDVTFACKKWTSKRGRTDDMSQMQAGTATVTLFDKDRLYDPHNSDSPLYGQVKPLRPCNIEILGDDGLYDSQFWGWLKEGDGDYDVGAKEITFTFEDMFLLLDRFKDPGPVIEPTGPTTTGAAIRMVLQLLGVPVEWISVDDGDYINDFSADGSKSGLQVIQELVVAADGVFYISRNGVATFENRYAKDGRSVLANIKDARYVRSGTSLEGIKNHARARWDVKPLGNATYGELPEDVEASVVTPLSTISLMEVTAPENRTIKKLHVYLDGLGGVGLQDAKLVIYSNNVDEDRPETVLRTSDAVTMIGGSPGAWVPFTFATWLNALADTKYWIGLHTDDGVDTVIRRWYDPQLKRRFRTDTYADGAGSIDTAAWTAMTEDQLGFLFYDVGQAQEYEDVGSRWEYGRVSHGEIASRYFRDDQHAYDIARAKVMRTKDPINPLWGLEIVEDGTATVDSPDTAIRKADLLDRLFSTQEGMEGDFHVENIEHTGAGGAIHQTKYVLTRRSTNLAFTIGQSVLVADGAPGDGLGY